MLIWKFIDVFFMVFHFALVLFNLFGWIWKKTRKVNLITLALTGASWFILGIFFGIGYCPLTDWHWKVLRKLGYESLPGSYMKFLIDRVFNTDINPDLVDIATLIFFLLALIVSVYLNFLKHRSKKKKN